MAPFHSLTYLLPIPHSWPHAGQAGGHVITDSGGEEGTLHVQWSVVPQTEPRATLLGWARRQPELEASARPQGVCVVHPPSDETAPQISLWQSFPPPPSSTHLEGPHPQFKVGSCADKTAGSQGAAVKG